MPPAAPAPQATTSQQAMQQLQQFQSGAKTPDQLLQESQGQLGVPQAQQQVQGLQGAIQKTTNLLNQVAPSVMGRTQNSLVTDAQANRQIANETAPVQQDLSSLGQQFGTAQSAYQNASDQATQKANAAYQGQQGQLSYLQQVYNSLQAQEQAARDEAFRQQQAAEATRQYNQNRQDALAAAAAARSSGLSLPSGGNNPQPSAPAQPPRNPVDIATDMIRGFRNSGGGNSGWGGAANFLKNNHVDVSRGSAADIALNRYFNGAGFQDYINSLRAEKIYNPIFFGGR